jgi:peroxiredoxin
MKMLKSFLCGVCVSLLAAPALVSAEAVPGQPAPAFKVSDAEGNLHQLSDYAGEWLVLEWFNKDCPFVKKHYTLSGNMPSLQAEAREQEVNWLTVISSAEGKQGYLKPAEAIEVAKEYQLAATASFLLDTSGDMGRAYGAKTTPHMYIINPDGVVVYAGAIDSNSSANPDVISDSTNYVTMALNEALAGKPVSTAATQAYGCTVKY